MNCLPWRRAAEVAKRCATGTLPTTGTSHTRAPRTYTQCMRHHLGFVLAYDYGRICLRECVAHRTHQVTAQQMATAGLADEREEAKALAEKHGLAGN